jgi:hypothetical protein
MIRYSKMPRLHQWKKKDSYVRDFRVFRRHDKNLCGIDAIVDAIGKSNKNGMRNYLMIELYFATNYWLRNFKAKRTSMHPAREDAVRSLCRYSIEQMAKGFNCGVQAVPNKLERYYGRTMGAHGQKMDNENPGHYMRRAEVEQYKLIFDRGLAYCFDWQNKRHGQDFVLTLANTQYIHERDTDQKSLKPDFARFAMSMSRDIYLAPHVSYGAAAGARKQGIAAPAVHSSYLAGMTVLCAGSMCITNGVVTDIRSDSGHYKPTYSQLMNVVQHLCVMGVNTTEVIISDFLSWPLGTASEFLANNEHWRKRIDQTGAKYRQTKNVEQLVEDRVAELKKSVFFSRVAKAPSDKAIWQVAYKSVCEDLAIALNDPSWRTLAEKDYAMPRRKAPEPPRRKPPRPTTPHPTRFSRV